jgi:hypothetical protein
VDRKLVKQTVMTSVYGVTFVGARAQVGNRLKERGFEDNQFMYKVSCYAAKVRRPAAGAAWAACWQGYPPPQGRWRRGGGGGGAPPPPPRGRAGRHEGLAV